MQLVAKIFVTQPFLPPLEEFIPYLERIWANKILTNGGEFHVELEKELCNYLGVGFISLFNNGTIALITALKALDLSGEVITTPYSFVATSSALSWMGIKPVFVDIDPASLNIDPKKISEAITSKTTAILGAHCYGNPCAVEEIEKIALTNNLKLIYDAAHAFGINHKNKSVLSYGDLSVLSFHATKIFNTFEGGAVVSNSYPMKQKIDQLKNFGFENELTINNFGINGKMSEINAAFGLLQIKYVDKVIKMRGRIHNLYVELLKNIPSITLVTSTFSQNNYSYFPILVGDNYKISRDELFNRMKAENIFSRRYFFPLINEFKPYKNDSNPTPVALNISNKIICLPIYDQLAEDDVCRICNLIESYK